MNIIPFQSQGFSIRAVEIDGEAWFVGKDIAEALGYSNYRDAMQRHCKGVAKHDTLQTEGGAQKMRLINEPDLFRLIVNSKLPSAEKFERWVFEDVLPTIRKTGGYQAQPDVTATLADPASLRGLLLDYTEKVLALEATVAEQAPKVAVYDRISEDSGQYLVRRAAKALGIGPGKFVDWMLANQWAYRHNGKGHLLGYQDKLDKGWLAHKLTPFWNKRTGMEEITAALRVTSKGISELARCVPAMRAA